MPASTANQKNELLDDEQRTGSVAGPSSPSSVERAVLLEEVDACLCAVAPAETQERDRTIF